MNNKNIAKIIKILFFSLFVFYVLYNLFFFAGAAFSARDFIFPEYQILRVNVYGSSNEFGEDTISASVCVLDTQGNQIAVIERSWNANYIFVTFKSAEFFGKKYYFPQKVSGSQTILSTNDFNDLKKSGVDLRKYYLSNFNCKLLGENASFVQKTKAYFLGHFSFLPVSVVLPSFSQKYTVNLATLEPNVSYGIFASPNGKLILKKE